MPSPNNVLTADSYIQDGLVFQLDGIEYGEIDGQWIDRKGSIAFDISQQAKMPTFVDFLGNTPSYLLSGIFNFDARNCSVDCIVNITNNNAAKILTGGNDANFNLWTENKKVGLATSGSTKLYSVSSYPATIHLLTEGCIYNGLRKVTYSTDTSGRGNAVALGGVNNPPTKSFTGSIYAIRIYSRQLSDREILINQKIDNARFGLGLDIPDEVLPASRSLSLLEPFELPDESESEQEPTNETSDER